MVNPKDDTQMGVEVLTRRIDPGLDAAQRAAMIDYQRRATGGTWVDLPNGQAMEIQRHAAPSFVHEEVHLMLAHPEQMLLKPKPKFRSGPRYQWRILQGMGEQAKLKANETARDARSGRVRFVLKEEVNPASPIALFDNFEHEPKVTWNSQVLVEIMDEAVSYRMYAAPEERALSAVSNLPSTVMSEPDARIGNKYGTKVAQQDVKQGG